MHAIDRIFLIICSKLWRIISKIALFFEKISQYFLKISPFLGNVSDCTVGKYDRLSVLSHLKSFYTSMRAPIKRTAMLQKFQHSGNSPNFERQRHVYPLLITLIVSFESSITDFYDRF